MKTLSNDLRERIVMTYDRGLETRQEVADRYNVSLGMVKKLLQQRRHTGSIAPRYWNCGAKPKITVKHEKKLRILVRKNSDMTLKELRDAIELSCTIQAIHYALKRMGLPLKKRRSSLQN